MRAVNQGHDRSAVKYGRGSRPLRTAPAVPPDVTISSVPRFRRTRAGDVGAAGRDRAAGSLGRARVDISRSRRVERGALIVIHGGPGVADMAYDAPAFAPLAADRGVYVYDGIGTGASSRGTR
jgi:hypothetical protein